MSSVQRFETPSREARCVRNFYLCVVLDEVSEAISALLARGRPTDVEALRSHLNGLLTFLPGPMTEQMFAGLDSAEPSEDAVLAYERILGQLLESWSSSKTEEEGLRQLLTTFCLSSGLFEANVHIISDAIADGGKQQKLAITSLLWTVLEKQCAEWCVSQSRCLPAVDSVREARNETMCRELVALPDVLANELRESLPDEFLPANFGTWFHRVIIDTLTYLKNAVSEGVSCSLLHLATLVSKWVRVRDLDPFATMFFSVIFRQVENDFVLRRLNAKLFEHVEERALHALVNSAFRSSFNPRACHCLFGDNRRVEACVVDRLTFYQYSLDVKDDRLAKNIVGYLAEYDKKSLVAVKELVVRVGQTWSKKSSIDRSPWEQHVHLSKVLVLACKVLSSHEERWNEVQTSLLSFVTSGTTEHMKSTEERMRELGMAVAQLVCPLMPIGKGEVELKFPFKDESDEDSPYRLMKTVYDGGLEPVAEFDTTLETRNDISIGRKNRREEEKEKKLDSDDSDDDDEEAVSEGVYYQGRVISTAHDLGYALISEDASLVERALKASPSIIKNHAARLHDDDSRDAVLGHLAETLLYLQEKAKTENFEGLKHEALVVLAQGCPRKVPDYLAQRFFTTEVSMRQRLDILGVFGQAVGTFNEAGEVKAVGEDEQFATPKTEASDWRKVIDARVAAKTRRFFPSSSSLTVVTAQEDKFAAVAGNFFYPLVVPLFANLSVLGTVLKEPMVLEKYLYTLGRIYSLSRNAPMAAQMTAALFGVVELTNGHEDASVRSACLWVVGVLASTAPKSAMSEVVGKLTGMLDWIKFELNDPSEICRDMASRVAPLISRRLKEDVGLTKM